MLHNLRALPGPTPASRSEAPQTRSSVKNPFDSHQNWFDTPQHQTNPHRTPPDHKHRRRVAPKKSGGGFRLRSLSSGAWIVGVSAGQAKQVDQVA